jgi:hypothetical protein
MRRGITVGVVSVALCLGSLVFTQAGASSKTVRASGGSVTFTATVRNAKTCEWSSSPKIAGFNVTVKCISGRVSRLARFKANASTQVKRYTITLTAKGATTGVTRWTIKEARIVPPTTTTAASPTTTTTVFPVTTTTVIPVTTTTETQIYDQPTTLFYDGFLSYNEEIGGLWYATEDADLTITVYPSLSPAAGTVDFYNANGNFICSGVVPNSFLGTVVSCEGIGLAAAPPTPIRAVYSGTQLGYDDGYGTSYAGSSAEGSPDP